MKNAKKLNYLFFLLLACVMLTLYGCEETPTPPETPEESFEIGDTGPAGGLVFYDKGEFSDGWRYIEVNLEDLGEFQWGCFNTPVSEARQAELGKGLENSEYIIAFHNSLQNFYTNPEECSTESNGTVAALVTTNFSQNGFSDWHLPSSEEMMLIYRNLHLNGLGNFNTDKIYWTSTEQTDNTAVAVDLNLGRGGLLCKQCAEVTTLRAVRYF